jgi:hypothetical protein
VPLASGNQAPLADKKQVRHQSAALLAGNQAMERVDQQDPGQPVEQQVVKYQQ